MSSSSTPAPAQQPEASWPTFVKPSFYIASAQGATFDKPFTGPWNRLLNTLFPPESIFEVVPQYFPPLVSSDSVLVDFAISLLVYAGSDPVFLMEINHPKDFHLSSKRQEADLRLRQRFLDCRAELPIQTLYGVSAFGTKMAFYKFDQTSNVLEPNRIVSDPERLTDTAPKEWWRWDVLEEEGAQKLRDAVKEVKAMCSEVPL